MSASSQPDSDSSTNDTIRAIDLMLDELASMTEQDCTAETFYSELLNRAVIAVASEAAVVWAIGPNQQAVIGYQCQANILYPNAEHKRYRAHRAALTEFVSTTSDGPEVLSVDSEWQIICCQIRLVEQPLGVIALYHRREEGNSVARALQHFVAALAELATDFEKNRRIRQHDKELRRWQSFNSFITASFRSLNPKETAFHIANEGRVYLECDRCSIFRHGSFRQKLLASSGLATVDQRSNVVRRLGALATRVNSKREPFFFNSDSIDVPRDLQKPLRAYLDETGANTIAVIPLAVASNRPGVLGRSEGTLVVEVIKQTDPTDFLQRCQLISEHATSALRNANEYQAIPLRPVWQGIRWLLSLFGLRRLPWTLFIAILLISSLIPLFVLETEFEIEARGELSPITQKNIFAPLEGYVDEIHVSHNQIVEQGKPLVTLRVPEKRREIEGLISEIQTIDKKIEGISLVLNQLNPNDTDFVKEQSRVSSELAELQERRKSVEKQREMLEAHLVERVIHSPIRGRVVTWQVEKQLHNRPVKLGEPIMKVLAVDGEWELELEIPDRKVGYVLERVRESDAPVPLRFVLETSPDHRHEGLLKKLGSTTDVGPTNEPYVRATASFDNQLIDHPRPGASVMARIDCGKRSIGYVWLHDLIDEARRRFFW